MFEFRREKHPDLGFTVVTKVVFFRNLLGLNWIHSAAENDQAHSHGGNFFSLILWGGYTEQIWHGIPWSGGAFERVNRTPDTVRVRKMWTVARLRKEDVHKLSAIRWPTITITFRHWREGCGFPLQEVKKNGAREVAK